jgi:PKD repeat protein
MGKADAYNHLSGKKMCRFLFFSVRLLVVFLLFWAAAFTAEADLSFSSQIIANFGTGQTRNIQIVSNHAYVCGSNSFESWDITDINNPVLLDSVYQDEGYDLAISGDYAYIAGGWSGFRIVDISDPSNLGDPVQVQTENKYYYGVSILGTKAFLAGYDYGSGNGSGFLEVFNITNPASPSSVGTYTKSGDSYYFGVEVKGDYAYVAADNKGMRIFNISNPAVMKEVWSTGEGFNAYDIEIEGNLAYLAAHYSGLKIYDITDPENPVLKTTYNPTNGSYYPALTVVEDRVYARGYAYQDGNPTGRLDTIDVSDPANPVLISTQTVDGTDDWQGVDVSDNLVYTTGSSGISVIAAQTLKATEGTEFSFEVPLLDADTYTWSLDGKGTELGMSVDEAGKVTYADPTNDQVGFHTIIVTATAGDTTQQAFTYDIWVENLNQAPSITPAASTIYGGWGSLITYSVQVTDMDTLAPAYNESFTYSLDEASLGEWMTIGSKSGVFSWTPTKDQVGEYTFTVTVTDAEGLQAIQEFTVRVFDIALSGQKAAGFGTGQTRSIQIVSNHAFVCGSNTFESWDITDINNPVLLDSVYSDEGRDLAISGDYAYIAGAWSGFRIVNISDPSNLGDPVQVQTENKYYYGVFISGTKAFLAGYDYGSGNGSGFLEVFNITNPASPSSVGTYTKSGDSTYYGVEVKGDYAYVAADNKGMRIFNISNPAVMKEVWSTGEDFNAYDIEIEGNLAYLAAQYNGLKIYDLTDPENPVLKTTYNPTNGSYYPALTVVEDRVYARGYAYQDGNSTGRLDTIDVSDPANPVLISTQTVDGTDDWQGVDVQGNLVYTTGSSGISVIAAQTLKATEGTEFSFEVPLLDADTYTWSLDGKGTELGMSVDEAGKVTYADPTNDQVGFHTIIVTATAGDTTQQAFTYDIWVENLNQAPSITPAASTIYGGWGSLITYSVQVTDMDTLAPAYNESFTYSLDEASLGEWMTIGSKSGVFSWTPTKDQVGEYTFTVTVTDAEGLQAIQEFTVRVFDIALSGQKASGFGTGQTRSIQIVSNHAFVCGSNTFESWDITDINNPELLDSVNVNNGYDLAISGDYAYIANGWSGFRIVDISDPSNLGDPVQVQTENKEYYGVFISGTKAFLAGYDYGSGNGSGFLEVFNITNPASPSSVGTYTKSGDSTYYGVEVKGDYAYVAADNKGMRIFNISNPAVIKEVWSTGEGFNAYDIEIEGNLAYLAAQYNGLKIYDLTDPVNPVLKSTYKPVSDNYFLYALTVVEERVYARGRYYNGDSHTGRLDTIDVSDPANPVLISTQTVDGTDNWQGVDVQGNLVYTTGSSGISVIAAQTLKATEGTEFSFEVTLLDADTYTWSLDGKGTELGMSVDEAGKVTYADPANDQVGFHTFIVTATAGDTTQQTFTYDIWVENLNQPPEITNTELSLTWYRDLPNMYQILANDPDLQAPGYTENLTFSLDAESVGLGAAVDADGLVTWTPTKTQMDAQDSYKLALTVTDAKGAKVSKNLSVSVATPGTEYESNDTVGDASSLIPGKPSKGDLSDDAKIDYYTFTLDQNKLLALSLITQGTADYKVELLSSEAALTIDDILLDKKGLASFSAWYETDFSTGFAENDILSGQFKIKDNLLLTWGDGQFGDQWSNGLKIYELGSSLKTLGQVIYEEDYWSEPIINGTRIYLRGNNRKGVVDFTNPNTPTFLGSINEGEDRNVWDAQGDYIFASKGYDSDNVHIYKIGSNTIQEVSSITLDKVTDIYQIKTGDGLLFVRTYFWEDNCTEDCGDYLNVFDISTPETPVFIRKFKDFQELQKVTDDYVWTLDNYNGNTVNLYQTLALKNNENPVPISSLTLDHYVNTIYGESPFFFAKGDNQFSTILINQNGYMKLIRTETDKGYLKEGSSASGSVITLNQEWVDNNGSLTRDSLKIGDSTWVYESFDINSGVNEGDLWAPIWTGSIASGHTKIGLKPGTYYVRVTPGGDDDPNQDYGLRYDDLGGYNDSGQSFDLSFGTTYENSIYTLLDQDMFHFSFTDPTFFEFSFDNVSTDSDYILSLLNDDEKIIDQFNLLAGEDVFAGINLFADTYQFTIENFTVVDAAESYTFTATKEDTIQPLLEMEPNDSEEYAMPLVLDEKVKGYISGNEDADMYRLSLNVSKAMDIIFSSLSGSGSYQLTLEIGGKIIDQIQTDASATKTLPVALFPGNYILRVTGTGVDSSDPYTIELQEVLDVDREFEPNNGIKFANGIDNGALIDGRLYGSSDLDFYGMSLEQKALVEFKLIPDDTQATFSVTITNAAGTQIASFTANQTENSKEVGCKAGKLYVRVTGTNLDTGLYTIQVDGEVEVVAIKELLSVSLLSQAGEQSLQIEKEGTQTLVLYGSFSDGSVVDLSDQASWNSTDETVADVLEGTITAKVAGNATINASYGGKTGKITIGVNDPGAGEQQNTSKQGYGNLIVLAGGGTLETNHLKDTTQQLCDMFYMKFKGRGFDDNDIFYLNPIQYKDLDGNGFDDQIVDTTNVTVDQFLSAITGWAKNYDSDGPLYIYLNDHGAKDQFQINVGEILTASQFHSTLNTFQETTGREVVVIIEACHSGTFVDNLTTDAKGSRLVITSSGEGISYLGTGGTPSFSGFMIDTLYKGGNFNNAFALAKTGLTDSGKPYTSQEPQMVEVNLTAEDLFVVGDFALAPMFPEIPEDEINVPEIVAVGSPVNISVKATGVSGGKVWATIKPVNYEPPAVSGDFLTPELKIPSVDLVDEKSLVFDDVFEGTYEGFKQGADYTTNGVYEVVIFAQDMEQNVTKSAIHLVTLTGGDENAIPNAEFTFSPAEPESGELVSFTDISTDDGTIESWSWDFGDGEVSAEQHPSHTYSEPGTYTASLTVTDDEGVTGTYSVTIIPVTPTTTTTVPATTTTTTTTTVPVTTTTTVPVTTTTVPETTTTTTVPATTTTTSTTSTTTTTTVPTTTTTTTTTTVPVTTTTTTTTTIAPTTTTTTSTTVPTTTTTTIPPTTTTTIPQLTETIIDMSSGWNLINSYLEPENSEIASIFFGIEDQIVSLWKWEDGKWAVYLMGEEDGGAAYSESKGFILLQEIHAGEGFWTNITDSQYLTVSGTEPSVTALALVSGWNLIGLKSDEAKPIADFVSGNETKITSVWKWDNGKWAVYLPGQEDGGDAYAESKGFTVLSNIEPGEGFWVNCTEAVTLD